MNYQDRIYGSIEITQPILLDLMGCEAMLRLQRVLQHGITGLLGVTRPTTRYEHSLGVMVLARRMGASLDEQIAALLHDVSHTAFSHVIDYVFHDHEEQGYHERYKESFLATSDVPLILAQYGYDWRDCLNEARFSLLEQPAPALCADRLDYFLRDCIDLELAAQVEVENALAHLVVHQGRIVADNLEAARWMGYTYLQADEASWANFREVGLYELMARAIRYALENDLLSLEDLWGGDREVWRKLHAVADLQLGDQLALVSPATQFVWDEGNPTFHVSTKLRTLDPDVLLDGRLQPLSALDADFARHRLEYLERKAGPWPVRVVRGE